MWDLLFELFMRDNARRFNLNPSAGEGLVLANPQAATALRSTILFDLQAGFLELDDIPQPVRTALNLTQQDVIASNVRIAWDDFYRNFKTRNNINQDLPFDIVIRRPGVKSNLTAAIEIAKRANLLTIDDIPDIVKIELGFYYVLPSGPQQLLLNLQVASKNPNLITAISETWAEGISRPQILQAIANETINITQIQALSNEVKSRFGLNTDDILDEVLAIRNGIATRPPTTPVQEQPVQSFCGNELTFDQILTQFKKDYNVPNMTLEQIGADLRLSSHLKRILGEHLIQGRIQYHLLPIEVHSNPNLRPTVSVLNQPTLTWEDFLRRNGTNIYESLTEIQQDTLRIAINNQIAMDSRFFNNVPSNIREALNIRNPALPEPCRLTIFDELCRPNIPIQPQQGLTITPTHIFVGEQRFSLTSLRSLSDQALRNLLNDLPLSGANKIRFLTALNRLPPLPGQISLRVNPNRLIRLNPRNLGTLALPAPGTCITPTPQRVTIRVLAPGTRICIGTVEGEVIGTSGPRIGPRIGAGANAFLQIIQLPLVALAEHERLTREEATILILGALANRFGLTQSEMQTEWENFILRHGPGINLFGSESAFFRPENSNENELGIIGLFPQFEDYLEQKYPPNVRRCRDPLTGVPNPEPVSCGEEGRLANALVDAYCSPHGKKQILGGDVRLLELSREQLPTRIFNRAYERIKTCWANDPAVQIAFKFLPIARHEDHLARFLEADDFNALTQQKNDIVELSKQLEQMIQLKNSPAEGLLSGLNQQERESLASAAQDLLQRLNANLTPYDDLVADNGVNFTHEIIKRRFDANEVTLQIAKAEFERILSRFNITVNNLPALEPPVSFDTFMRRARGISEEPTQRDIRRAYRTCCPT